MAKDGYIAQISPAMISEIKPIPLIYYEKVKQLAPDQVWLSPITELEFPFPEPDNPNQKLIRRVINMATPCCMSGGATGYLIVMVDVLNLRNILSLYNSSQSPIWAFERTAEERYFYIFDLDGWILFQSEPVEKPHADLSSHSGPSGAGKRLPAGLHFQELLENGRGRARKSQLRPDADHQQTELL
jgi:hypothetical protein